MQKKIIAFILVLAVVEGFSACGTKCKTCYTEVMGVKSPEREVCGDQLKQVESTPGMVCK